jgi:NADH dehydrogenase
MATQQQPPHILIVGGGYVGMYTALRLQKKLRKGEANITVIDPNAYMTYQPFLPEAAAGNLEPRHMVVPLRRVLSKCQVITGRVTKVDHASRTATIRPTPGERYDLKYDAIVMAPGSIVRTLPIPGLVELGIGFKTVAEAIFLRNHVLGKMDLAASTENAELRKRALTFVVIGGGYAGIEALGELEDMTRDACRYYDGIEPADLRWVLVEASPRILPEVSQQMAGYTVDRLKERGIDLRLATRVESLLDGHVRLSDGFEFDTETVVWTAGVKPSPLLAHTDLPLDARGRVRAHATLAVEDMDNAWSAGDCAAVPDLSKDDPDATCAPSAQHAVRQTKVLADNIVSSIRGGSLKTYKHAYAGSVASLGLHKGVAEVKVGRWWKIRGFPAWFMHRTYHLSRVPTFNRKVRVMADWTLGLFFRREIVSLGAFANPRREWERANEQTETFGGVNG